MKPAPFRYLKPESLDEALAALAEHEDAKVLAGGQSLIPAMNMRLARPAFLIDLNPLRELQGAGVLTVDTLNLPAMVRHAELRRQEVVATSCPVLRLAAGHIGHAQIRHRGTLGGSLAHAEPAAELPLVAVLLDAVLELKSVSGCRAVGADEFFEGYFATNLRPDEIVTSVRFPAIGTSADGFAEFSRREGDYAIVAVAVRAKATGGADPRVAVAGVEGRPMRLRSVEALLAGQPLTPTVINEAARLASASVDPLDDPFASGRYKSQLTQVLVRRALLEAAATAQESSPR